MKRTDHAARNETHKSSPPRVDPARGERHEREKEGTVGEDIARHEVSLLFVIKIPRLKGSRGRRERGKREREREKGRVFSRGSGKKESRVWKNTRFQLKRQA